MANGDIGNQLSGVSEGLDRFLEALDASSMGLGSQDALKKIQARAEQKRLAQNLRFKAKIEKMEKTHFKQLTESIKSMKLFNKNMADMAKKGLGKGLSMLKGAAKAGVIGAAVLAIKAIVDGLLQIDGLMAKMVAGTGRLRSGLDSVRQVVLDAHRNMDDLGVTLGQAGVEATNMTQQFGRMSMVTADLVTLSLQLQKGFGMSAESSGQLLESLTRINVNAREFVESLREGAVMAGTNVALVMRNVATITKDISIQNARSVESLKQMAIQAAQAGVGVEELSKMGGAFMDPQQIGENIGRAAQLLGGSIGTLNPFKLWNLADQPAQIGTLNKTVLDHLSTTVKLSEEGNLIMQDGTDIRNSQLKAMTDFSGMTAETTLRLLKQHEQWQAIGHVTDEHGKNLTENASTWASIQDAALEASKWTGELDKDGKKIAVRDERAQKKKYKLLLDLMKTEGKIHKEVAGIVKERENEADIQDALNQTIRESQTILQRLKDVFMGVFHSITREMGVIFGLDNNDPDSLRGQIDGLSNWIKEKLNFGTFAAEVAEDEKAGMGKFESAFKRLKERLIPIFEDIGKAIGRVLASGLSDAITDWKRNNAWADWLLLDTDKENMLEEMEDLQAALAGSWSWAHGAVGMKEEQRAGAKKRIEEIQKQLGIEPETEMAKGGIVTRPTRALIGEAGPELVLPLGGGARRIVPLSGTQRFQTGGDIIPLSAGMFTGITAGTGTLVGSGSEARRQEVGSANIAERRRQQAPIEKYWRKEYDRRMEEMEERQKQNSKSWQDYAKKFFLKYEGEVGKALGKALGPAGQAGKEMSTALMAGMNAWSSGKSASEALSLGVRAGLTESLGPGGVLGEFFEKQNSILASGFQEGLLTFARTGNIKQAGRQALSGGIRALTQKYLGKHMGPAAQYMGQAAGGRVVNSPGLFMAGEGGNREVIVPTDRIRKGLPINSSVAHELSSIGVPGFGNGGYTSRPTSSFPRRRSYTPPPPTRPWGSQARPTTTLTRPRPVAPGPSAFEKMGGLGGIGKAGAAGGLMTFASTFAQGGSFGQAAVAGASSAVGTGIGMGATAALSATPLAPLAPILGPMIGQVAGQMIGPAINKVFGLTGGRKKARRRAGKSIEQHIRSGGLFDFGQPSGLRKNIKLAIGGKEKQPTEESYQKLVDRLNRIKGLARAGVDAGTMIDLATGKISGANAMETYKSMNVALYGSAAGDKYMKAAATPQLAAGGIVTKPTTATIGEGGPEMVIPLHEQREANQNLVKEMKEQNKLMKLMIQTQKDTGGTEIIMDGRKVAETVGQNMYNIGTGI